MKLNERKKKRPTFIFLCPSFIKQTNETQPTKRIEREKNRTIDEVDTREKERRKKGTESSFIQLEEQAQLCSPFLFFLLLFFMFSNYLP